VSSTTITIITLSLAVVALAFSIYQTRDLMTIKVSMSTRYLGRFPEYVGQIAELIDHAEHSLVIVCDVPGYSLFSNRKSWLDYERAVKNYHLKRNSYMKLVVLDATGRLARMTEQLQSAVDDWPKWLDNKRNMDNLETLLLHLPRHQIEDLLAKSASPPLVATADALASAGNLSVADRKQLSQLARSLSPASFIHLLNEQHRAVLNDAFGGIHYTEVEVDLPVYFWIADDRRAIFSIPNISAQETEHAFITSDHRLIRALTLMQERLTSQREPGVGSKANV
jgi:hypothetical protein